MSEQNGFKKLKAEVIDVGLCCGCGTCAGICPEKCLSISLGEPPYFEDEPGPRETGSCSRCSLCWESCPGKEVPLDSLDRFLFGRTRDPSREPLGIYRQVLAGYSREAELRQAGASGGAATAILAYALEEKVIDGAVVAVPHPEAPWRFVPGIVTGREGLIQSTSSKYCIVPSNAALREAVEEKGLRRIGVMGCPCHIEAIRKIQMKNDPPELAEAVRLTVSLFCATNFLWQATRHILVEECGINDLQEVKKMVYRGGQMPKHFIATLADGSTRTMDLFPSYLNYFFPYQSERCSVCIDWSGELADISVGDLWEPFTRPNEPGWNALITRTAGGEEAVTGAVQKGYLFTRPSNEAYTIASLGCECKKHGHVYNLHWRKKHGWPAPDFGYEPFMPGPWPHGWRTASVKAGLAGQGGVD